MSVAVSLRDAGRAAENPGTSGRARLGPGTHGRKLLLAVVGFSCWVATLLPYSFSVTPFQRFEGLQTFITFYPRRLQVCCVVACLVVFAFALRGRFLPGRALAWGGGCLHVFGCALFAAMSLIGVGALPEPALVLLVDALSVATCLGSVATALEWGRAFKGFGLRSILIGVALSGAGSVLVSLLVTVVPPVGAVVLFVAAAVAAAALPSVVGMRPPLSDSAMVSRARCSRAQSQLRMLFRAGSRERGAGSFSPASLKSFTQVAAPALLGLACFAYVMALMGSRITEVYGTQLTVHAATSIALLLMAAGALRSNKPLLSIAYRRLVPVVAVVVLAVTNISGALFGGSGADMVAILLLYNLTAMLALCILGAIARADEFSADAVFAIAFGLFSLVSFVGFNSTALRGSHQVAIVVITTVYAAAMVVWGSSPFARDGVETGLDGDVSGADLGGVGGRRATSDGPSFEERCAIVVDRYRLTEREAKVMAILAEGYSCSYASEVLYISPSTARTHAHNIYAKLGIGSREELMVIVRGATRGNG